MKYYDSNQNRASDHTGHPLDPLSADEIETACRIAKDGLYQEKSIKTLKVTYITLIEPKKEDVLKFLNLIEIEPESRSTREILRACEVCLIDLESPYNSYLVRVNLSSSQNSLGSPTMIETIDLLPIGTQSSIALEEVDLAEKITKTDSIVQQLCHQIGIETDQIFCDAWALGFDPRFSNEDRLLQCLMYARLVPDGNLYAHPLDFIVIVNINSQKVIHIDFPPIRTNPNSKLTSDSTKPPPLLLSLKEFNNSNIQLDPLDSLQKSGRDRILPPRTLHEYLPDLLMTKSSLNQKDHQPWKFRKALKPLEILQPEGVNFKLDGHVLDWQKWSIHLGYNYREGLVLNTVTYDHRALFYRMSLVEMVVPYGAPEYPHHRKFAFDVGEYGLGNLINSLVLGCDCLGSIQYMDVVNVRLDGKPTIIKNAICIHEEDDGILWKHSDLRFGGRSHTVRSRKLVVSMICTVANYDYLFYWNFYQDGSLQFDIKLTGILNIYLLSNQEEEEEKIDGFGSQVAPRILAQHHAHTFCLRIDPMIDGVKNSVIQTDLVSMSEPTGSDENFLGNGFRAIERVLKRTHEGAQDYDHEKSRYWSIINPNKLHYASRAPIGYRIACRDQPVLLAKKDSMIAMRAPFAKHHLFVTRYVHGQFYPSGRFVPGTTSTPNDSIERWLEDDQSIDNEDIVVYVTFGINHVPSPEQFPVMSTETVSVGLKPSGFFPQNASLDVPAQINEPVKPFETETLKKECTSCQGVNGNDLDTIIIMTNNGL